MKLTQFKLANGLNVFLAPLKDAPSVAVSLMIRAGSAQESVGQEGLAHFLEHMAFKGTEKWPRAIQITKLLDSVGAFYNAGTYKEKTRFWVKLAPKHLNLSLEVIAQLLNYPLFKKEEIEKEKQVIAEEFNMYEDQPIDWVDDLFETQLLGNNPLGKPILGDRKVVAGLKRPDFINFRHRWYRAGEMSLAVVGAVGDLEKVKSKIKRLFGPTRPGKTRKIKVAVSPAKETIFCRNKKTQQTHISLGLPLVAIASPKTWPASVATAVLGGGMSSRLCQTIREKRSLAYYVYGYSRFYSQAGFLGIKAGVRNEIAPQAIELIRKELIKMTKDLKKEEVARAKQMISGHFTISMENPAALAYLLNTGWLFEDKVYLPQNIVKAYQRVTYNQVKSLVEKYFDLKKLRGAVIGPGTFRF